MPMSLFKNGWDFDENVWVVTFTGKHTTTSLNLLAHAMIVVEAWLTPDHARDLNEINEKYYAKILALSPGSAPIKHYFTPGLFVGEYEVVTREAGFFTSLLAQALATDDVPMTVRLSEYSGVNPAYRDAQYPTWIHYPHWTVPKKVIKMIETIKDEAAQEPLPYHLFGGFSFFNKGKPGENCVSWATKKLALAGIDERRVMDSSSATIGSRNIQCSIL